MTDPNARLGAALGRFLQTTLPAILARDGLRQQLVGQARPAPGPGPAEETAAEELETPQEGPALPAASSADPVRAVAEKISERGARAVSLAAATLGVTHLRTAAGDLGWPGSARLSIDEHLPLSAPGWRWTPSSPEELMARYGGAEAPHQRSSVFAGGLPAEQGGLKPPPGEGAAPQMAARQPLPGRTSTPTASAPFPGDGDPRLLHRETGFPQQEPSKRSPTDWPTYGGLSPQRTPGAWSIPSAEPVSPDEQAHMQAPAEAPLPGASAEWGAPTGPHQAAEGIPSPNGTPIHSDRSLPYPAPAEGQAYPGHVPAGPSSALPAEHSWPASPESPAAAFPTHWRQPDYPGADRRALPMTEWLRLGTQQATIPAGAVQAGPGHHNLQALPGGPDSIAPPGAGSFTLPPVGAPGSAPWPDYRATPPRAEAPGYGALPSPPVSRVLEEARLREMLAEILRTDALRHGLVLKER